MSLAALFAWPAALPLLLLAPLAWLLLRAAERARARRLERALGARPPGARPPGVRSLDARSQDARAVALVGAGAAYTGRQRLGRGLWSGALALALLALLQPLWGGADASAEQSGVDVLVCLDVSRSMLARDLPPSRLQRAQEEIEALAERAQGDRLGLVCFAGEARLSVPLTADRDSYAGLVELAGPESVRRGGTDLGAALEAALAALQGQSGAHEAVLLLSDGEDLEQRGLHAAQQCRERGIVVHCVGFGSALGSKITLDGPGGESFLRDRAGREVVSTMDPAGLRRIAEATGGAFVDAGARPHPLLELYEQRILPMARKSYAVEQSRERGNRYQWPLLAAFLLWILELGLAEVRRR